MPDKAKVSVLTACYNHGAFIEETIKSVLMQETDFAVEHIICDDGSDDASQSIIMRYAARHPSILPIIQPKHAGATCAYLTLMENVRSPYVAICDGDDYFTDPLKLQIQADFLDGRKDCALCFHPARVVHEDDPGRERLHPPLEELPRGIRPFYHLGDLIRRNMIQTNAVMYRWRFRDGLPDWFRSDLCPGDWYWHLLHAEKGKIGFINKVMSVYRRHAGGIYALAEQDPLKHRNRVAPAELIFYTVVNEHFQRRYEPVIFALARAVFLRCLRYKLRNGENAVFDRLVREHPAMAEDFFRVLETNKEDYPDIPPGFRAG
jgi:glycosyltransferase involved in cell wall biosynthesis